MSIASRNLWANNHGDGGGMGGGLGGGSLPPIGRAGNSRPASSSPSMRPSGSASPSRGDVDRPKGIKPQLLLCSLCGSQFGSASLEIHQPQCFSKKLAQWQAGDPATRGPKPRMPSASDLQEMQNMSREEWNQKQFDDFNTKNMSPCPNCGRTFLADRLQVHLRSCKPGAAGASKPVRGKEFEPQQQQQSPTGGGGGFGARPASSSPGSGSGSSNGGGGRGKGAHPKQFLCSLCGQPAATANSLAIHIPQCYTKMVARWQIADPATRGPKPRMPSTDVEAMAKMDNQQLLDKQFDEYSQNLVPCPNGCGRRFASDRLPVHLRSCKATGSGGGGTGASPMTPPRTGGGGGGGGFDDGRGGSKESPTGSRPKGVPPPVPLCPYCSRPIGTASLAIHMDQCYTKQMILYERTDPTLRGKRPKPPSSYDLESLKGGAADEKAKEEWNQKQAEEFKANMRECPTCGRRFLADRLEVHLRSCKPGAAGASKPVGSGSARPQSSAGPSSAGGGGGGSALPPASSRLQQQQPGSASSGGPASAASAPRHQFTALAPKALPAKLRGLRRILLDDLSQGDAYRTANLNSLAQMLRTIDAGLSDADVAQVMASLDSNSDGVVDSTEWQKAAASEGIAPASPKQPPLGSNNKPTSASSSNRPPPPKRATPTAAPVAKAGGGVTFCDSCGAKMPSPTDEFCDECGMRQGAGGGIGAPPPPPPPPGDPPASRRYADDDDVDDDVDGNDGGGAVLGMVCNDCGEVFEAGSAFCEECGTKLEPLRPQQHSKSQLQYTTARADDDVGDDDDDDGYDGGGGAQQQRQPQRSNFDELYEDAAEDDGGERVSCSICGRRFALESIAKHEKICQKIASKPRKVFDAAKMRAKGTEIAQYMGKGGGGGAGARPTTAPTRAGGGGAASAAAAAKGAEPKWKKESQAFRQAMKQAREVTDALAKGGPLPAPTYTPEHLDTRTPCPYCGRKFAADVADRHIPKCRDTVNKPKPPPRRF